MNKKGITEKVRVKPIPTSVLKTKKLRQVSMLYMV